MMKLLVLAAHFENDVVLFELLLLLPKKKKAFCKLTASHRGLVVLVTHSASVLILLPGVKKATLNPRSNESFGASTSSSFANNQRLKAFTQPRSHNTSLPRECV